MKFVTKRLEGEKFHEVQKKKRLVRENNKLKHANQQLLSMNISLEQNLSDAKEKLRNARRCLMDTKRNHDDLKYDANTAHKRLQEWELWWTRLQTRALDGLLQKLQRSARRPRAAPDGCWGGGQ